MNKTKEETPKIELEITYRPRREWSRRYQWEVYRPGSTYAYYENEAPWLWLAKLVGKRALRDLRKKMLIEKRSSEVVYRKEIDVK